MGDKLIERKCFDYVQKNFPCDKKSGEIYNMIIDKVVEEESPDFIIAETGVEHFLVDLFFITKKRNAMSLERMNSGNTVRVVEKYKQNPNELDEDIENGEALQFIERVVNSQFNAVYDFSCQNFIRNFLHIFDEHYNKIEKYKKKCEKIGFLIEVPYIPADTHGFLITKNQKEHKQCFKAIPIPYKIEQHIFSADKLSFVIILLRPMNTSGTKKENVIYYFDVERKLTNLSNGCVCDSFDYAFKIPNKNIVKLQLEGSSEDDPT